MRTLRALALLLPGCFNLDGFMFSPDKTEAYAFPRSLPDEPIDEVITASCVPELVELESEDGTKLFAVFTPGALGAGGPAIFYLHGNGDNLDRYYPRLVHLCNHGYTTFMVDYRGYGMSEGSPSEEGVYADARAALAVFLARPEVNPDNLVIYGMSLGAAVAVELAREIALGEVEARPRALILDSAFASVQDIVDSSTFVHFPAGILGSVSFNNVGKIAEVGVPVLVMHGERDDFIPIGFSEELFAAAVEPKRFMAFPDARHVELEISNLEIFDPTLGDFLAEFAPGAP
jgi:hypothetical protein